MEKKKVYLNLDLKLIELLNTAALESKVSRNEYLIRIIEDHFNTKENIIKIDKPDIEPKHNADVSALVVTNLQQKRLEKAGDNLNNNWSVDNQDKLENDFMALLRANKRKEKENG